MLAIISDLHLQHTAHDVIRYFDPAAGTLRALGVRRNVSAEGLDILFAEIESNAAERRAEVVHLILAGDILELQRTPLWFAPDGSSIRPTDGNIGDDVPENPLRAMVLEVLDHVEEETSAFWVKLRAFVERRAAAVARAEGGPRVEVHYIPGNHDRLTNAWASLRLRIRKLFGMAPSDAPFPHVLDWSRAEGYGVRVRHGQEYDPDNYGADRREALAGHASLADYLLPTLGDYMVLDCNTRLALAMRAYYPTLLRLPGERGAHARALYAALTEFDDVRPQAMLVRYLTTRLAAGDDATFGLLRPVLLDVYDAAAASPFFVAIAKKHGAEKYLGGPLGAILRAGLQHLAGKDLAHLVNMLPDPEGPKAPHPADSAATEPGLAEGLFDLVVCGHTHDPDVVPLPGPEARGMFYLDTGTWRTRIGSGSGGAFGALRSYTMVLCYADSEVRKDGDQRRFESWTGRMPTGQIGVFETATPATPSPVAHRLRFLRCQVRAVPGGDRAKGVTLHLELGADGEQRTLDLEGVRNGAEIELAGLAPAVDLHPELDGELWGRGAEAERFTGEGPLPWVVDYLPREPGGAYRTGPGSAVMKRSAQGGAVETEIALDYEVVPVG
jgi:hypothetical protein